jgi:hypothetical protein
MQDKTLITIAVVAAAGYAIYYFSKKSGTTTTAVTTPNAPPAAVSTGAQVGAQAGSIVSDLQNAWNSFEGLDSYLSNTSQSYAAPIGDDSDASDIDSEG